jgi:hypothetical protein
VKQENISIDYAHAHSELMKKPDEVVVQAFWLFWLTEKSVKSPISHPSIHAP